MLVISLDYRRVVTSGTCRCDPGSTGPCAETNSATRSCAPERWTTANSVTTARSTGLIGRNRRRRASSSSAPWISRAVLKLGIHLRIDVIRADEFCPMLILKDEREKLDREELNPHGREQT